MQHHNIKENISVAGLVEDSIKKDQGLISTTGALVVNTGKFTGRSPKDRFIVKDDITSDTVDWGEVNLPIDPKHYDQLESKMLDYVKDLDHIYMRDAYACASRKYRINVKVYTEFPWQNLFAYNMFLRPDGEDIEDLVTDEWSIYAFPGVLADASKHGTRQENFSIINFSKKIILIGGTAYTGEIKKGIFSVLNYVLPTQRNVLSMQVQVKQHCPMIPIEGLSVMTNTVGLKPMFLIWRGVVMLKSSIYQRLKSHRYIEL